MDASLRAAAVILLVCLMVSSSVKAQSAEPYTPRDIRAAYGVDPLLNSGYTGNGVTVAIVNTGIDSTFHSDLGNFSLKYGLPQPNVSLAEPFSSAGTDRESPTSETTADAELVHAMAPDARILLVLTGYDWQKLPAGFSYVIDKDLAGIATISPFSIFWGQQGRDAMESYDLEYEKSVAENITLIAASGDWGANNSVNPPWIAGSPYLYLIPPYSPYVTVVGGTALTLQSESYGSEVGWNMSGGGPTNVSPEPSWQTGPGVPENRVRNTPDVALDASCDTPYAYYWNSSTQFSFCGTSGAAPTFAGILADIEQAAGRRLGFLNPTLYSLASSDPTVFHDVTSGCSLVQVEPGTIVPGYCAHPGWDFVSGLGSIDAARLASHLAPSAHIVLSTTSSSISITTISSNSLGAERAWFTLSAGVVLAIILSALAFRRRIKRTSQQ